MRIDGEITNKGFLVILNGIEEVVGKKGMATLLRQASLPQYINNFPPSDMAYGGHQLRYMSLMNHALFDIYGARGARAILQRVGRERWKNALAENAGLANATKLAIRFLPRRMKIKLSMDTAAKAYNEQLNAQVKVSEEGGCFYWDDYKCGNCIDWKSEIPVCHTTAGFVFGLVAWALDSDAIKVEEVACRAKGDPSCRHLVTLTLV